MALAARAWSGVAKGLGGYVWANRWSAAAVLAVAGGAAVRLAFVDYGLPYWLFWDENYIVRDAFHMAAQGKWWPPYHYDYPSGMFDIIALTSFFGYLAALRDLKVLIPFEQVPLNYFILPGRLVVVGFAVLLVWLVYKFAARVWGRPGAGVAAAALLALSHHHIAESRQVGVDIPMTALALAALFYLFRYREEGKRKHFWYAALALGGSAAFKYNGFFLLPPAFIMLASRRAPLGDYAKFAAVVMAVFVASTPGLIFNYRLVRDCLAQDYFHYKIIGHREFSNPAVLSGLISQAWRHFIFPPPLIFAAAGVPLLLISRRVEGVLFLLFPASFIFVFAGTLWPTHRFIIDLWPFVALLFGLAFASVAGALARLFCGWRRSFVIAGLVVAVFGVPAAAAAVGFYGWAGKDQRVRAKEWLEANVPWPASVVKERWDEHPLADGGESDAVPVDELKYRVEKIDWLTRRPVGYWAATGVPFYIAHCDSGEATARAAYYPGALDGAAGNPDTFWCNFRVVKVFRARPYAPYLDAVVIYRLADDLLVRNFPYTRVVPLERFRAVTEEPPHEDFPLNNKRFSFGRNARMGGYVTLPPGPCRLGFHLRPRAAGGVPPRLRVYLDGRPIADFAVTRRGFWRTAVIPAGGPRYRHLLIKFYNASPAGAPQKRRLVITGVEIIEEGK